MPGRLAPDGRVGLPHRAGRAATHPARAGDRRAVRVAGRRRRERGRRRPATTVRGVIVSFSVPAPVRAAVSR
ncbi:hypothetical protein Ae150APs1_0010 [Pseudonocardia sp. Ae150A_Ps1]|nr:hypothetical protein Ae150APs1_0010 [Pseudonocardia sp. Ae150A_Ps1]